MKATAPTSGLKLHPLCEEIPAMRPHEWDEFYADVTMRGIRVPLEITGDGTILDGRHRFRAAQEMGLREVPVMPAALNGDDPADYMFRAAVMRRHLKDDQRAVMAARWKERNKKQGERTDLTSGQRRPEVGARKAATDLFNVTERKVKVATTVLAENPELADKVHKGDIALNNAHRQVKRKKEKERIANTKPPTGTYQVLVVDPPWPFSSRQDDPTHEIANQYEPMSLEDIQAFALPASPESALWLWVPNAFLHDAFHVLEAWGFTYRTALTWVKNFPGLGDWLAGHTEHCLLATRGNYTIQRDNESTFLKAPRGKHSEKPDEFYALVDRLCPGIKIDIFARKERDGWDRWGAEAPA